MYKASIKQILMSILYNDLLVRQIDIYAFAHFGKDLLLSEEEFNRFLYFVEMQFNIDLSNQQISLDDRFADLVSCIYTKTILENQFALQSA
jgi:hypothetical protein